MSESRKAHFEALVGSEPAGSGDESAHGIWELPDHLIDVVAGGADFHQDGGGGYVSFAQNFGCFAQNIGNFSQGTYPMC